MKNLLKILPLKRIHVIIVLPLIFACACTSQSDVIDDEIDPNERGWIELEQETRAVAENLQDFYLNYTLDAIKYVDSNNEILSKNTVVSPLSASMVLAMLANGVDDEAKSEILEYLGVNDLNDLNGLSEILLSKLPTADNRTEMKIANAIWVNEGYKLNQDFSSLINLSYQGEINYADFNEGKKTANAINKWCSAKTNGLIPEMFDEIDPLSMAILLNAVFFKGKWHDEIFLKENTKKEMFHGIKGSKEVDMMHASSKSRLYNADDSFEIFYLHFGNCAFSFIGIVPREGISSNEAIRLLTPEKIRDLQGNMVECDLAVDMPRFKIENKLRLDDIFKAGGLEGIFRGLDVTMFEKETAGRIRFNQAANLEIDENGAKLAAVTSGELNESAPALGSKQHVRLDRPFFFFIRENGSRACLLSGRIADL